MSSAAILRRSLLPRTSSCPTTSLSLSLRLGEPRIQSHLPDFGKPPVCAQVDALAESRDGVHLDALCLETFLLARDAQTEVAAGRDDAA